MDSLQTFETELRSAALTALAAGERPTIYKPAGYIKVASDAEGTIFVASEESEDRMGDIIDVGGWDITEFRKNPVVMLNHDYGILPIGVVKSIATEGKQLIARVQWDMEDELAAFVRGKYERGIMRAVSVGFRPLEWDAMGKGIHFKKQELLELSAVSVPAHPHALAKMMGTRRFAIIRPEVETEQDAIAIPDFDVEIVLAGLRALKEVS